GRLRTVIRAGCLPCRGHVHASRLPPVGRRRFPPAVWSGTRLCSPLSSPAPPRDVKSETARRVTGGRELVSILIGNARTLAPTATCICAHGTRTKSSPEQTPRGLVCCGSLE